MRPFKKVELELEHATKTYLRRQDDAIEWQTLACITCSLA